MLIPKLGFLKSSGVSIEEAMAMVLWCPVCFTFSIENNLKPNIFWDFLAHCPHRIYHQRLSPLIFYGLFISAVIRLVPFASIVEGNFFNTCVFVKKPFEGLFSFIISSTTPVSLHCPTASKSATYTL
ncbi:LOW QUALITY PROTEIN: hypothetical protein PanWU01x14_148230 [Parasponia andersonii]|uniref:Uncharacterized protein n=1 Tax=Parasponia andersonii TaxID=3476 RepID=A0A2P5CJ16_PARAD|nr:LOW QUALITY PROTEIN: hypothetical protein PanWU01x14_148230 [Parasponia andersonii]